MINLKLGQSKIIAANPMYKKVPKLEQIWRYGDDFSPEVNEEARKSALKEIREIKKYNEELKLKLREGRKNITKQSKKVKLTPKDLEWFNLVIKEQVSIFKKELKTHKNNYEDSFLSGYKTQEEVEKLMKNDKKFRQWIVDEFFTMSGQLILLSNIENFSKSKKFDKYVNKIKEQFPGMSLRDIDKVINKSIKIFKVK